MKIKFEIGKLFTSFINFCSAKIKQLVNEVDADGNPLTGLMKKEMLDDAAIKLFNTAFEELVDIPIIPDKWVDDVVEAAAAKWIPVLTQKIFDLMKFDAKELIPKVKNE